MKGSGTTVLKSTQTMTSPDRQGKGHPACMSHSPIDMNVHEELRCGPTAYEYVGHDEVFCGPTTSNDREDPRCGPVDSTRTYTSCPTLHQAACQWAGSHLKQEFFRKDC